MPEVNERYPFSGKRWVQSLLLTGCLFVLLRRCLAEVWQLGRRLRDLCHSPLTSGVRGVVVLTQKDQGSGKETRSLFLLTSSADI